MAQRRETKKAPPDDQTVHDERLASILDMTFEQQVDFLGKMHENDLRMSNTKAKPKAQFQIQPDEARLAKLPTEVICQIGIELAHCGYQNIVSLAKLAIESLIMGLTVDIDHFGVF
ncbi:hypothetical protein sscle_15g105780 [Sclerotinia sclerotiorum 1980 UF-70]|uniref:Uncharacterized protein n=1 Tax=Sclerotinia sclerotiorum (strain ATCC 18683 / 1980 / Ss-1) TaxID=665079 RepID=A0A1D9QLI7_SCLS1|nr:hypothetical protein sscle_15g105780 [Sclerotinia sclerotiorum 1980 UF-70]